MQKQSKFKVRWLNLVVGIPFGALGWFCLTGQAIQWIHFQGQVNQEVTGIALAVMAVGLVWSSFERRPAGPE
jgi:hypothetical protein